MPAWDQRPGSAAHGQRGAKHVTATRFSLRQRPSCVANQLAQQSSHAEWPQSVFSSRARQRSRQTGHSGPASDGHGPRSRTCPGQHLSLDSSASTSCRNCSTPADKVLTWPAIAEPISHPHCGSMQGAASLLSSWARHRGSCSLHSAVQQPSHAAWEQPGFASSARRCPLQMGQTGPPAEGEAPQTSTSPAVRFTRATSEQTLSLNPAIKSDASETCRARAGSSEAPHPGLMHSTASCGAHLASHAAAARSAQPVQQSSHTAWWQGSFRSNARLSLPQDGHCRSCPGRGHTIAFEALLRFRRVICSCEKRSGRAGSLLQSASRACGQAWCTRACGRSSEHPAPKHRMLREGTCHRISSSIQAR
mmetsp:Transcript_89587/g.248794  ORF Transcript_89587/g.248794 Transcript_89587/m.248794 type:complete len:363 (+) Transcript_89587:453-1541(+)